MEFDEKAYEGGYYDGLDDAANIARRLENHDTYIEIRKTQGWHDCPACCGTGERKEITQTDIISAVFVMAGARTNLDRPCHTCWGERVVKPTKAAA